MSSSRPEKPDPGLRLDGDDGLVFPAQAEPTDDSPTIISKSHPTVEPPQPTWDAATELHVRASPGTPLGGSLRGRQLAHFELIEPIGVGGMAAVLRARDTQLDRQVALKILPPEMAADPENVRRFHQEAKAAARLDHPNIAGVFYCGEDQGLHFIAFEFVEGDNLRVVLERRGRLPVAEAVRYVLQVATGLEHAAARGVVHRDVKPSNIIISPNGRAKLVDMGLARNMERHGDADLTQSGVTLGTFDYISPEQALEPRDADARSDMYSLGCTFYHMLTGQPPVPEGTAAKKLHHHQHVAPVDPRQLNPDIPDEVALILGRMMAKDPRGRYQRPLQLVQHLMQVARKVGVADDLPEGVLFVDTPLPTGPRSRPMLIVSLTLLALGVVIAVLAVAPGDRGTSPGPRLAPAVINPPTADRKGNAAPVEPVPVAGTSPAALTPDRVVHKPGDLARILQDAGLKDRRVIKLSGDIDVTDLAGGASVSAGPSLVVESNKALTPAVLLFRADRATRPAALVLDGGNVTFRNLIIQVQARDYPEQATAALAVRGAGQVVFERCRFKQEDVPPFDPAQLAIASVLVEAPGGVGSKPPRVEFRECLFEGRQGPNQARPSGVPGGQVAVALDGPGTVTAVDCGFYPHGAFFQLRGRCRRAGTTVGLKQCSGLVYDGPVFRFEPQAGADLGADKCLFSRPDDTVVLNNEPDLIFQPDHTPIRYVGTRNYYHHLNALWSSHSAARNVLTNTLDEFQKALAAAGAGKDEGSKESAGADEGPWYFADPLRQAGPQLAFQVKPEFAAYGLRRGWWGELEQPRPREPVYAANVKVFDPDFKGKSPSVYNSLDRALANLERGDTLLIKPGRDARLTELPPSSLKAGVDITIRAFEKTSPVLTLGKTAEKKDVAFFRMLDGKVRFEGLHFVLEPRQDGAGAQSVLLLGENAQCSFDRCAVTLRAGRRVPLSVVALVDPKELMRPDQPRPSTTRVQFTSSFVRGDGDLAGMTACRPLRLALDNTLCALGGALVNVQAAADDVPVDQGPQVELRNASVFTREPAFTLHAAKNGKGLGCTRVEAHGCLFAPLADRPLVYVEVPGIVSEDQLARYLDWKGEQNCFANFDKLLEQERPNEMGSAMQLESGRWEKLFGEQRPRFERLGFAPLGELALAQATPAFFRPNDSEQFSAYGATIDLDALLKPAK